MLWGTLMFKIIWGIALLGAGILQFGFIHRYLFCSKNAEKRCLNSLCDYYGNGWCERGVGRHSKKQMLKNNCFD